MPLDFLKKKSLPASFLKSTVGAAERARLKKLAEPPKPKLDFAGQQPIEKDYQKGIDPALAMQLRLRGREEKIKGLAPKKSALAPFWAGVGDVAKVAGSAISFFGAKREKKGVFDKTGQKLQQYGAKLQEEFIEPEKLAALGEFSWDDMLEPEFYRQKVLRSVPFALSLIPASIAGAYAGAGTATAVGLGTFGRVILGSIGATALSRPIESALEAGSTYDEILQKTGDQELANKAANEAFAKNLSLAGMDVAEFATAFLPTGKIPFLKSSKLLRSGVVRVGAKLGAVGAMEATEEILQEKFQREAVGEEFKLGAPTTKEAGVIGGIFGIGMAGAGEVFVNLQNQVIKSLPEKAKKDFEKTKAEELQKGFEEPVAQLNALDKIAVKHKGAVKEAVKVRIDEIKAEAEPEAAPVITEPQVIKREKEEPITKAVPDEKITSEIKKLKKREAELERIVEDTEGVAAKEEIELGQIRKKIREQIKIEKPTKETEKLVLEVVETKVMPELKKEDIVGGRFRKLGFETTNLMWTEVSKDDLRKIGAEELAKIKKKYGFATDKKFPVGALPNIPDELSNRLQEAGNESRRLVKDDKFQLEKTPTGYKLTTPNDVFIDVKYKGAKEITKEVAGKEVKVGKRPIFSKRELKVLIENVPEFKKYPKLKVILKDGEKLLQFKTDKTQFSIKPEALGLVDKNLKEGQEIILNAETLKIKGEEIRVVKKEKVKGEYKTVGEYADTGGYADIPVHNSDLKEGGITDYEFNSQKRISDITQKVKGIEMPELVKLYKELTNAVGITLKNYKSALGKFYAIPKKYNIGLNRELFVRQTVKDETVEKGFRKETDKEMHDRIAKTFAHELGHMVDFLPDEVMTRGNILGRLFVLSKFRGEFIGKPEIIAKRKKVMQQIGYRKQLIKKGKETKTTKEDLKALEQELIELSKKLIFKQPFQNELINLTQKWKPFDEANVPEWFTKYRYSAPELYADFMSALFSRPDIAKQYAPKFYEIWFKNIDKKPEFKKAYFELQLLLHGERKQLVKRRYEDLLNMFKKSDEIYKQQLIERVSHKNNFWYEFKKQMIYKHQWATDAHKINKEFFEENPDIDPKTFMEEDDLIGSAVYGNILENIAPIKIELQDAGLSWNELSAVLFVERISKSGSREGVANPLGHTVQSAKELRDYIYNIEADKKKADILFNSAKKLRKALKNAMTKYPDLYSPEMFEKIKSDDYYAPFNTAYKVFNKLPAGLKHQTGNLNDTNNIANNVILKYIGIIYSGEKNIIATKTSDMIRQTDGKIQEADYVMTGKKTIRVNGEKKTIVTRKPKEPDDVKLGLITTMEKGKLKGYYVPANIADSFKYDPVKTQNLILHYAFVLPNKYFFKPVYTTLNPGFQMVNFLFRDLMTFKKIPGMNWIKLFKYYKESLSSAYKKAWGKFDQDINTMFDKKLLSTHNSGKYKFAESVDARNKEGMDYILQMAGLDNMKGKYDNIPILKQAKGVIDFMQKVGDMLEATPKIAGYKYLQDNKIFANDKITEHWVRANIGSPNFFKLSGEHATLNNVSLFYNAVIRGWERTYETATYKQSKSAFWWHMAKYAIVPAVLTVAAEEGMFGDEVEKQMKKISEYMKNNYVVIPIKISDKLNKVVFISLPMAEEDRLIHAITRIALRGVMGDLKDKGRAAFDIASYTGGQVPGFAPQIELGFAWYTYLTGGNPFDMFRSQHVFLASEEKAGDKIKLPIMVKWTMNKSGIIKMELHDRATNSTAGEAIIKNTPILHRFLRISNYGEYEADQAVKNREGVKEATEGILFDRRVVKAVNDYWKETPDDIGAYAIKVMPEVLGEEATKKNFDKFQRLFKRYIISGLNNAHLNSLASGTTRQKVALLVDLKKNLAPDDFNKLIQMGISTKTLSETVMKEYLIKINQENANKAFK